VAGQDQVAVSAALGGGSIKRSLTLRTLPVVSNRGIVAAVVSSGARRGRVAGSEGHPRAQRSAIRLGCHGHASRRGPTS
jgi:hypothetical protein